MQKTNKLLFSPDKDTVVDFVPGFILINHSGKLLKKCAIFSMEKLVQKCKKESRQFSAFMVFRCILSPNFRLGYGEASVFYGKLWSKTTPTLRAEMIRIGNIVKSKLKQDNINNTADSRADSITDANGILTHELFSNDLEFSNANIDFHIDRNEFEDFIDHTNLIDYPIPQNCENFGQIHTHVNPNVAIVDTRIFHNDDTLNYNNGIVAGNVDTARFAAGISGNFAYDNAFTLGGSEW